MSCDDRQVDLEAFGKALADALGERSQAWLAAQVENSQGAVSRWINGHAEPEIDTVFAVERVLGVAPGELMCHLGYVPAGTASVVSVPASIRNDARLNSKTRRALISLWRSLTESDDSSST